MFYIRRGLEPLMTAIILIALSVALSIAIAFWASGIFGNLGGVSAIQIKSLKAKNLNDRSWIIILNGINKGSTRVSIIEIMINGRPAADYYNITYDLGSGNQTWSRKAPPVINSGQTFTFYIVIYSREEMNFVSGQIVEVVLQSSGGIYYKRTVVLP